MAETPLNVDAMNVADTNIVIRIIVRDDPDQVAALAPLLEQALFVPATVLLETVWVLSSRYRMKRNDIADAMLGLLDLPAVEVDAPDLVAWAIERFRAGGDFADMLHLVVGRDARAFVTFDRTVSKLASGSPLPIVTLRD